MDYLKLKGRIDRVIQSRPFDYEPLNDLLDLCREYEKIDFEVAHAWNHGMRPAIAYALKAAVERNDFLAAERLNDLLFRSLIFSAPHYFDACKRLSSVDLLTRSSISPAATTSSGM